MTKLLINCSKSKQKTKKKKKIKTKSLHPKKILGHLEIKTNFYFLLHTHKTRLYITKQKNTSHTQTKILVKALSNVNSLFFVISA